MEALAKWFASSWAGFKDLLKATVNTIFDAFKDLFYFIFEILLDFGIGLLDLFSDALAIMDPIQYLSMIPADVKNIMGLCGMGEAMAMVMTAIGIRLLLQLIPFVRLGS